MRGWHPLCTGKKKLSLEKFKKILSESKNAEPDDKTHKESDGHQIVLILSALLAMVSIFLFTVLFSDSLLFKISGAILGFIGLIVSFYLIAQFSRSPTHSMIATSRVVSFFRRFKVCQKYLFMENRNENSSSDKHQTNLDLVVGGIAHELSNPVMSMVIMSEYLLEKSDLDQKKRKIVGSLLKEGNYCADVIKAMVRHSKVKEDSDLISTNINQLMVKIHDRYKEALESDGFEVKLELSDERKNFPVDESSLNYIFNSLISHARISMAQSPRKELTFGVDLSSGVPRLWLKDSGDGISSQDLDRLFSPEFIRPDNLQNNGVNLSICQAYAGSFGGSIEVQTVKGHGSVFFVRLRR